MSTDVQPPVAEDVEGDDYTRAEQAHYQEICQQGKIVRALRQKAEAAKEKAKAAKSVHDEAAAELDEMIERGPDLQLKLSGMEDTNVLADSWRSTPLIELALGPATLKALEAVEIITVGDLADWQEEGDNRPLTDITGIGPTKAEEINERLMQFWEEHPEVAESED